MIETSEKFQLAIRTTGRRKTLLRVRDAFGTAILFNNVPIVDGSISVDRNSDVRRTANVTLGTSELVDLFKTTSSNPFGMEIEILSGIVYPNGSEELVRMGIFTIDGFEWSEGDGTPFPTLELMDRSQFIHRARLSASRDFSGYWAKDVIESIVRDVIPTGLVDIDADLPNARLPGGSTFDDDRWEVIRVCAQTMGAEAYFDRDGVLRVTEIKDPTATLEATVWTFNTGKGFSQVVGSSNLHVNERPTGILVSAQRSIDRKQTYNGVIVYGAVPDGKSSQPFAIATDNDPLSPTYYNGTFGKSIFRVDNSLLATSAQCADAAVSELRGRLGYSRGLSFSAVSNPALDDGDYVLFHFQDNSTEVHLLDSFVFPLAGGEFTGETRTSPARQTSSIKIKKSSVLLDIKPSAPSNLVVTGTTNSSVSLDWTASTPGRNPIKQYDVYRGDVVATTVTTSSATVTGLPGGTSYAFHVVAIDHAGIESISSKSVTGKTTGPTGPPLNPLKYTTEFHGAWSASYNGALNKVVAYGDLCYQGFKDDGQGVMRSLIGFDEIDIQNQLTDAYISACYVTLYFKEWATTYGGTAMIGYHNYASEPATWADGNVTQDIVRSIGWPSPGRRAVNVGTTIGNAFKNGTATGISLGPSTSNNKKYRGICEGVGGGSVEPILTIVYTKES